MESNSKHSLYLYGQMRDMQYVFFYSMLRNLKNIHIWKLEPVQLIIICFICLCLGPFERMHVFVLAMERTRTETYGYYHYRSICSLFSWMII